MRSLVVGVGRRSIAPYIMLYENDDTFRYNLWGFKHWSDGFHKRTADVQRQFIIRDTIVITHPLP